MLDKYFRLCYDNYSKGEIQMKNCWVLVVLTLIIVAIGIGGAVVQAKNNQKKWNDGHCECGHHWELKGATKIKNGGTTKYYACPNCFEEIEIKS